MTQEPEPLSPRDSAEDAASSSLMQRLRIGSVPIAERTKLVGALTRSDVLGAFLALARDGGQAVGA